MCDNVSEGVYVSLSEYKYVICMCIFVCKRKRVQTIAIASKNVIEYRYNYLAKNLLTLS
jgi:hypothetical protein